jgi:hypothetical protein
MAAAKKVAAAKKGRTKPLSSLPPLPQHTCHARGCPVVVPRKMFMCTAHWYRLTKNLRDAVWCEYQPGQEDRLVAPTEAYLKVTDEAIRYIAKLEGRC